MRSAENCLIAVSFVSNELLAEAISRPMTRALKVATMPVASLMTSSVSFVTWCSGKARWMSMPPIAPVNTVAKMIAAI
jgi:hypothetical protein